MSLAPAQDFEMINDCLYEAELVEELGLDAIWLSEHHFDGETVYADPMVFAGAITAKTKRVTIGLGVVEMALHHPVRLAVQTSLLDNMSQGRLIVGTGRGTRFNAFEYLGFGTTAEVAQECLEEAEELLVKAWTSDRVDHNGKFWQSKFPGIRPRPYQKPHPRINRACVSDNAIMEMARLGRPILIIGNSIDRLGHMLKLYRDTMANSGVNEEAIEEALDRTWVWRDTYVAETNDQALEEFMPQFEKAIQHMNDFRDIWNPKDGDYPKRPPPLPRASYGPSPNTDVDEVMLGSPKRVAEHVALLKDNGVRNLMMTHRGLVSRQQSVNHIRLLSEKIVPLFR